MQVLAEERIVIDKPNTDEALVRRCQQGDTSAFRQIYQNYQARVRATLYQLCGGEGLDDLTQEVFLKAWKNLPKLREIGYFSTWLYRIAWNTAIDRRKKLARDPKISFDDDSFHNFIDRESISHNCDLTTIYYQELVSQSLQSLSLEHRAVLILHDLEDLPQKDIARILEIPIGTVKSRLHHARNYVKNFLQERGISL